MPVPATNRPATWDRRTLLGVAATAAAYTVLAPRGWLRTALGEADPFTLPPLPYDRTALQPVVSGNTLDFHHGKHHATYVKNLNDLVKGKPYASMKLEEIVKASAGKPDEVAIFNNAAQTWNHTFYWNSMRAGGGGKPTGRLLAKIDASFGGHDKFREAFVKAATVRFGSGWAWLVASGDKLEIVTTANAETPLTQEGKKPLLTVDVWEHAYYLDWQNKRKDFVEATLDKLLNWEFADKNLG
jgi:Fe-Mn family superoxide dismutase